MVWKITINDKCIVSNFANGFGVIICFYAEDLHAFSTNMECVFETKKYLTFRFRIKDLNEVNTISDSKVKIDSGGYAVSQSYYLEEMLS